MAFTSIQFILFFIIVCLIYFILNNKLKLYWLLVCSYYFYMCWNVKYAFLMLFSTFITYLSGVLINKSKTKKVKKIWVILSLVINLSILIIFKYYNFFISSINPILDKAFSLKLPTSLNLLLPVGISFYTFQALSYTIDIYRNDVAVEKNFFKYALFVSFFPQLVAGPIEKSKDLLNQFSEKHKFSWNNLHEGLLLIVIGFFFKLVISDRAALAVNTVYNNLNQYRTGGGIYLIVASIMFAIQIYFDFFAYSIIAKGSAQVLGYKLSTNFNKPYFATSIKDFWRRWHISLSSWFKEYLYFPLGGSKKGFIRTQINMFIVFAVSGLWHGAAWNYIIWGILHGIYQIIENIVNLFLKNKNNSIVLNIINILKTFILVDFAWIFFRANTIKDAFFVISHLFDFGMVKDFNLLGLSLLELIILTLAVFSVFTFDLLSLKVDLKKWFYNRSIFLRFAFYYLLLFIIIIFGIYGPGFDAQEFIYFQF